MIALGVAGTVYVLKPSSKQAEGPFDGERAYQDVLAQVALGPRTSGSSAHEAAVGYIRDQLEKAGWQVTIQDGEAMGHPISNISAGRGPEPASILLGAHYDTRLIADRDPDPAQRNKPGPGADDGASGVAVLLELARTLPRNSPPVQLVFLDAEDNGEIPGWDWILGSRAFAENLRVKPEVMILVDMVGDTALTLPMEQNSDAQLTRSIWDKARSLGYGGIFLSQPGLRILDDHVPFIEKGIPSVDIIDINYPYWHTSQDTADHVSPRSLQAVGATLLAWIRGYSP